MDVRLDQDVFTSDGEKVGTVDEIIIHPDTMQMEAFLVREGVIFAQDRIIEPEFIDRVDNDGKVYLNITKDREEDLPTYVEREYVRPDQGAFGDMDLMPWFAGAGGRVLVPSSSATSPDYPAPDSLMQPAPIDPEPMQIDDNLPEDTVRLSEGTDVVDKSGEKVGTVDEIFYDEGDTIQGFIVRQGTIFKQHVRIPADWIEAVTDDYIRINRSAEEAETAGRMD